MLTVFDVVFNADVYFDSVQAVGRGEEVAEVGEKIVLVVVCI